ncbi:hypothetical protein [Streptomyces sp. NBC_00648]|uniref:hypothetical protein n=1 Tax=Streptomyces sp. NBC_00648 TaxID=2975797 RepID=UPI00386F3EAC
MKRRRAINRLRGHLTEIFPGLERELDLGNLGSLLLLTGYQTPAASVAPADGVWPPGCTTARSAAPPNSQPKPSGPQKSSTPPSLART